MTFILNWNQESIGRPVIRDNDVAVGPFFFDYGEHGECIPQGPFSTFTESYGARLKNRKSLITSGEIAASAAEDALAVNEYLSNSISSFVNKSYANGPFFLSHPDTRDCNFLVDDDFTITGVIDWEVSAFVPRDSAFKSPLFMVDVANCTASERR